MAGKLLKYRTTAGYAHIADARLVETSEKVGEAIAEAVLLIK